jgi:hypothetical protein
MLRYALWGLIGLFANPALGQQAPQPEWRAAPSPSPNSLQPLKGSMTWEEPMPGDHWIFETRDEITGEISTQSNLLTELSPAGIRVQINIVRSDNANNGSLLLYDRSWKLLRAGPWQFFPYDGSSEIQTPLAVGKSWTFQFKAVYDGGLTWNRSGSSRVIGQETVTTKGGTFETFEIETTSSSSDFKDSTRTEDVAIHTWYAPAIAHWVKRISIGRTDKHLRLNDTLELLEFGRKQ